MFYSFSSSVSFITQAAGREAIIGELREAVTLLEADLESMRALSEHQAIIYIYIYIYIIAIVV